MRKLGFVFLFCSFSVLAAGAADAEDHELRTVLEGRYAALKAAMAARDEGGIASLLAPGFVSEDVSGEPIAASQMIQQVMALPLDPNKTSKTTILSVEADGNIAVAGQRYEMKTKKVGADGVTKDAGLISLSTDTWVVASGAWLLQRTVTNQIDYSLDGQAVFHKARPSTPQ